MGVYIKGVTKQELKEIFGKACIRYNSTDLIEVKTPHGRLIDADAEYKALSEMKVEGEVFVTAVEFAKIEMEQVQTVIEEEVE